MCAVRKYDSFSDGSAEKRDENKMEIYINVKNFGKIKEARVNIGNFTVFVGNNNSGKTQLMELIYAIIKSASERFPRVALPQIEHIDGYHVGKEQIQELNLWINDYLKENITNIIEKTFNAQIPVEEVFIEFEETDDVSYDIYFFTEKTIGYLSEKNLLDQSVLTDFFVDSGIGYKAVISETGIKGIKESERRVQFSKQVPISIARNVELGAILTEIIGGNYFRNSNVLFLPASRMGLMLLYKTFFADAKADEKKDKEIEINENRQYSGSITQPVEDFLTFLLKHNYTPKTAAKNALLIQFIFNHLVDGSINEHGDVTTYTPKDQEKEIPIYIASSMVNEVVPIVKALTDSSAIDYIFYDEVETSLHPLKQVEMVKLLNRLNNRGIRLIISTHSDTMATKINNLQLLSQGEIDFETAKKVLEKKGISLEKEDLLNSFKMHVYQFINQGDGTSIVEELPFRKVPCTGYDFSLFNDSTMNLFEEAKVAMGLKDEI